MALEWELVGSLKGPQGDPGPTGAASTVAGPSGADGKTLRTGAGAPSNGLGNDGDFYIDTTAWAIYGPKTSGAWGSATSIVGPGGGSAADATTSTKGVARILGGTADAPTVPTSSITGLATVATSGSASDITTGTLPDGVIPSGIARDSEVATAVANLVNSAPGTLDTLGEIATQLAADESTATALATTVGQKAAKSANLSDLASASTARTNLGLGNVDNTADTAKPVSTAQQTALDAKAAKSANLSDLADAATARTNLALAPPPYVMPSASIPGTGSAVWPAVNRAVFLRFSLTMPGTYRYVNWICGVASGNIQVGVVTLSSTGHTSFTRVAHTGVIACPTAGNIRTDLGAFTLPAGDHALFLWADNVTFQSRVGSASGYTAMRVAFTLSSAAAGVPSTGTMTPDSAYFAAVLDGDF